MMSDHQCEVVYSYQGIGKDELTLQVGQVINIITKEVEDVGWWKGELDGVVGVFPENFVKLIAKDDKGDTKTKKDKEKAKILRKSISVEEKYDLASLKKELGETSIQRIQSQKEIKISKGAAPIIIDENTTHIPAGRVNSPSQHVLKENVILGQIRLFY
jgi:hypothetical protein